MKTHRILVSEQAPNGTHEVAVIDKYGHVVAYESEALFGVPDSWTGTPDFIIDGDEVYPITEDENGNLDLEWAYAQGVWFDLTNLNLVKYVAVSPVNDGKATARLLRKYTT